ncbi:DUF485 domain-containing protein [Brevibacillus fulvus]|uniref:Uncharacterized membrane protein (DUF485 family) n=1 Tax=Brevibacillus fulvus TaxID=1125967 RepID=A0A938XWW9_9BACL|nr:DUF485 domain-containing protein [Brevibacillus fulvus]MBM7588479.1 uncharacterized membrane protein (DUF485 family) [Brevibacillus fulvus]
MVTNDSTAKQTTAGNVNYSAVVQSKTFQQLLKSKKGFILPYSIFFFVFYFTLPIMTSYFTVLNRPAIGSITWAWVFAFAQFVMTWALCMIYSKRAARFDEMVEQIKQEIKRG